MPARRVVITGMGWVTPLGCDVDAVWPRLLAGQSAVSPLARFDGATFRTNFAAQVSGFRLEDFLGAESANHRDACIATAFALAAAARAMEQAGLWRADGSLPRLAGVPPRRVGVYLGAGEGTPDLDAYAASNLASWRPETREVNAPAWAREALVRMNATRELEQEPNMVLAHIARAFGVRGPSSNCMTACAASTQAVGEALEIIRHGDADLMIAGGSHSMIHPLGMTGFIRLTAMSQRREQHQTAARPFDQTRDGFVMGEGAGILVMETLEHATARGATPLAEIAGYGSSADAFRITDIQPDGVGAQAAMLGALRDAGINPREPDANGRPPVQYISAHGTGTKENDSIETKAIKGVFGPMAPRVPVSSVKSMLGHLIQAAGVVELMTCVQAIRTGWLPPTINLHSPDPACDLDYVPNTARDARQAGVDVCLSNGFGFGGQNDTVVVRRV